METQSNFDTSLKREESSKETTGTNPFSQHTQRMPLKKCRAAGDRKWGGAEYEAPGAPWIVLLARNPEQKSTF